MCLSCFKLHFLEILEDSTAVQCVRIPQQYLEYCNVRNFRPEFRSKLGMECLQLTGKCRILVPTELRAIFVNSTVV